MEHRLIRRTHKQPQQLSKESDNDDDMRDGGKEEQKRVYRIRPDRFRRNSKYKDTYCVN